MNISERVEAAREKAREAVWRAIWAKGTDGNLGGVDDAKQAQAAALDRLIALERAEAVWQTKDSAEYDVEAVEYMRNELERAIEAIEEAP